MWQEQTNAQKRAAIVARIDVQLQEWNALQTMCYSCTPCDYEGMREAQQHIESLHRTRRILSGEASFMQVAAEILG